MSKAKDHVKYVKAHAAHSRTSGCIVYCTGDYEPGNQHSHRWHAATQARNETRIPYRSYNLNNPVQIWRPQSSLQNLAAGVVVGGAAGITPAPSPGNPNNFTANVQPFATMHEPFDHNGHHIIPSSNLEQCIGKVVEKADPNQGRMYDLVVGGLLLEPYNNNDQPNMIVLPMKIEDSDKLGLPIHIEIDGQKDHPAYRKSCSRQLKGRFQNAYRSLAAAVAAEKHPVDQKVPAMRSTLVSISRSTYEAIIAVAISRQAVGKTLDEVRHLVVRMANKRMAG